MTKYKAILNFLIMSLVLAYTMLVQILANAVASNFILDLHYSADQVSSITACYFLSYSLMQIISGCMYDRYPIKPLIIQH